MAIADLLRLLEVNPTYRTRVVHIDSARPEDARFGQLRQSLPPSLEAYLDRKNIRLYTHQCEAIDHVRAGRNVIITTPTASGKTLAFNLPVFEKLETDPAARALYLYPTKALSNDQLATLEQMTRFTGISAQPAIYDGDTPQSKRAAIRDNARIIVSNPHELHQVLSWHTKWHPFFSGLQVIVIDEAHRYRGVFGSHIAALLRRLLRLCLFHGSRPQFVLSTATIANPVEFAGKLTGQSFELVGEDGSPHGRKTFVLYNPFFDGIGERSAHQETKDLLLSCVKENLQTLCFTGSRKMAELVTLWAREDARHDSYRLADAISAYRAGYLPEERRKLEHQLKNGEMKGVVSTNALELGIDIGSLDSVIISGYPGTMMSTRQQAGRAGRNGTDSLAILVAMANPLDQYFMNHPDRFFSSSHEHAIVDTANPYIISGHLLCAAAELPVNDVTDTAFFGESLPSLLADLATHDLVRKTARGWVYSGRGRAAGAVQLDGIPGPTFRILCKGKLLETMDQGQAFREAHKGAIMLHQGITYVVNEMDLETHTVRVSETNVDYYTQTLKDVDLKIIERIEEKSVHGIKSAFGEVEVTETITGYKIKRKDTVIGVEPLALPRLCSGQRLSGLSPLIVSDSLSMPPDWILPGAFTELNTRSLRLCPSMLCAIAGTSVASLQQYTVKPGNRSFMSMTPMKVVSGLLKRHTTYFPTCLPVHMIWYGTARARKGAPPVSIHQNAGMTTSRLTRRGQFSSSGNSAMNVLLRNLSRSPQDLKPCFRETVG